FTFTEQGDALTVEVIIKKFDEHYKPYKNLTFCSYEFGVTTQQPGQTIDDYVTELSKKARDCDFGSARDRMLRDQILKGVQDSALRERLLRETGLTLADTIEMCRAAETSKRQATEMRSATAVNKVNVRATAPAKQRPTQ